MKLNIFISGANGFVGKNLIPYLTDSYIFNIYKRESQIKIVDDIVLHLAGKSHDLTKAPNSDQYYANNTNLTKNIFDEFIISKAKVFITISSVKAVVDKLDIELDEEYLPRPTTHYGKSKLMAEQYILNKKIPINKRVYILRPCMIHGPGNKGNLNLLYKIVKKKIPWPLGDFNNKRSFCSIENLCFVIKELMERDDIPSGIYNIADDEPISTNDLIEIVSTTLGRPIRILKIPRKFILVLAKMGDFLNFPLNTERLQKLTQSFVVSNKKLISVLKKPLPVSTRDGLKKTIRSFKN